MLSTLYPSTKAYKNVKYHPTPLSNFIVKFQIFILKVMMEWKSFLRQQIFHIRACGSFQKLIQKFMGIYFHICRTCMLTLHLDIYFILYCWSTSLMKWFPVVLTRDIAFRQMYFVSENFRWRKLKDQFQFGLYPGKEQVSYSQFWKLILNMENLSLV